MTFLKNCIKGIAIGAGAILPGISSGVLCVILGIYEKLLDSILHFFHNIKKNFKFLFPICIGVVIGVLLFSNILKGLFEHFPIQIKGIFVGFMIGSIPALIKEANEKESFKLNYLIYTILAFLIGIFSVILENYITITQAQQFSFLYLMIAGFTMSIGVVVPGVSSTIILMLFGVYGIYLSSISNLYFPVLIPMGLGLLIGGIFFMKVTKFLFENFYAKTFYTIIGFTLGSMLVLVPKLNFDLNAIIYLLCIILGIEIIHLLKNKA